MVQLDSPGGIAAVIPHLLGFTPHRSLVLVLLAGVAGRLRATMRIDLPAPALLGADATRLAAALLEQCRHAQVAAVVAVLHPAGPPVPDRATEHRDLLAALRSAFEASGAQWRDPLVVHDGRWWLLDAGGGVVGASAGCAIDADPQAWRARAAFVLRGSAVLASRDDVVAQVRPGPGSDAVAAALRTLLPSAGGGVLASPDAGDGTPARAADEARRLAAEWIYGLLSEPDVVAGISGGAAELPADDVAVVLVWLRDTGVRDLVLVRLVSHGQADPGVWHRAAAVVLDVLRRAPSGQVAPVAAVAAGIAWLLGDGVLARAAIDRAIADEPGYSLARLIDRLLCAGVPPDGWRSFMAGLSEQDCLGAS